MSNIASRSFMLLAVVAAAGCASVAERSPALDDARVSVNTARNTPAVVAYAPVELNQAVENLRRAEDLDARGGRSSEVHDLAIIASQRAALAQEVARLRGAEAALIVQRKATEAQLAADTSRRQADSAQLQAAAAQRQADEAQRVASTMRADAYAPAASDYRRRQNEPVYEATVTSIRAVVGPPQERCWVEREQMEYGGSTGANIPGAIVGGVIGGILGHQIGGGRGQDLATGVGVIGGAAVGANVGRGPNNGTYSQDVRRCEYVPSAARPDYWDVTYNFRGYEHRVQMTSPPGSTIWVNADGEPRV
jgi:uncharacterized protein YcfJ